MGDERRDSEYPDRNPTPGSRMSVWVWLFVAGLVALLWLNLDAGPKAKAIAYTDFKQAVKNDEIAQVTFQGQQLRGRYAEDEGAEGRQADRQFMTTLPPVDDPELLSLLEQHEVQIQAKSTEPAWWMPLLVGVLPWVLIFLLIFLGVRKMQERMAKNGQAGGMFGFGKSKAKRFRRAMTGVSFDDVAGLENAKRDLREIIEYLKAPQRYTGLGAKIPKGILMMGPPGTGKTLLAKAAAGEAGVPFYSISGSEFIEMFVGVGASRVRDMFQSARKEAPAIIFIDEIDSVGRARGTGLGGGHDEREQTLNQILGEMDGFEPHEAVVVLAATNRPDVLDQALLRPGRFDRKVTLELPQRDARRRILEVHCRDVPLADDVDLESLAAKTVGFSGAELENLVNEAALLAGRDRCDQVNMARFDQARDKLVLGAERESMIGDQEKEVIAYHESGHALMAYLLPQADPLDKVTIIPRGHALGATEQLPEEERHNLKHSYLLDRIGVMLGGRVAEQLIMGEVSSGAEQDLKQVTQLARRMVSQWGMSETLGPVAFRRGDEHVFLGREMAQQRDFSEHTARLIDEEVQTLLCKVESQARELLEQHRPQLERLAERLLERETLDAHEIDVLLRNRDSADTDSSRRRRNTSVSEH
ncbi:cell division protein FtsH [Candidatus Tenderia electrophaga]|jgi:cell division protease FtsH|uniref:ATP-dependent zinc metalloprotease FtsH n=1 Tax=Candidatus Tenderia electrophaga TaxID=1748243 RepID=A0A0S2TFJ9_9GAMM|nr:cell division protein FtsH [Candidatus Tenderia electrophaga]